MKAYLLRLFLKGSAVQAEQILLQGKEGAIFRKSGLSGGMDDDRLLYGNARLPCQIRQSCNGFPAHVKKLMLALDAVRIFPAVYGNCHRYFFCILHQLLH